MDLVWIFWLEFCKSNVPYYVNWIINKSFESCKIPTAFHSIIQLWELHGTDLSMSMHMHPHSHNKSVSQKKDFLFNSCFLNIHSVSPVLVFYHGVCSKNGFNHIIHQILNIYSCLHYEYNLMCFIHWTIFCNKYKRKYILWEKTWHFSASYFQHNQIFSTQTECKLHSIHPDSRMIWLWENKEGSNFTQQCEIESDTLNECVCFSRSKFLKVFKEPSNVVLPCFVTLTMSVGPGVLTTVTTGKLCWRHRGSTLAGHTSAWCPRSTS